MEEQTPEKKLFDFTEITKSKSMTIQLKQYEPIKIHCGVTAQLYEDTQEAREQAADAIDAFISQELKEQYMEIVQARKKTVQKAQQNPFQQPEEEQVIIVEEPVDSQGNVSPF